jgi:flavin reductase (DIM6/NTAB) family NADH-FMN oxidoreductase RutF
MHLTTEQLPKNLRGTIWACLIAPRPIALISSVDAAGVPNIAPYNSYSGLANNPPLLGVSFSRRGDEEKTTLSNIKETGVFVINLVPRFLAEIMNKSAEGTGTEDDFQRLGLTRAEASTITCPRIVESPASLECRLVNTVPLPPSRCEMVVAQIVGVTIRDEFYTPENGFDPLAADLLASVGAEEYLSLNGETLHLPKSW